MIMNVLKSFLSVSMGLCIAGTLFGQDSEARTVQPNVPKGAVTRGTFTETEIFPGTTRDYSG